MKAYFDSHCHSSNSFDAESTVEELLHQADRLGLEYLTVTDHFEAPFYFNQIEEMGDIPARIRNSIKDTRACQQSNTRTKLLCGIELGEPLHDIKATEEALGLADYDFVLCSLHNLKCMEDFFWLDYSAPEIPKLLKAYFLELLECIQWGNFSSLAHITYPLRYICDRAKIAVDLDEHQAQIDEVLSLLAEKELALEFNTCRNASLGLNAMKSCRDIRFLKRFKELGGRYITLGSDAHKAEDLAKGINGAVEILKELGYKEATVYIKRQPCPIAL